MTLFLSRSLVGSEFENIESPDNSGSRESPPAVLPQQNTKRRSRLSKTHVSSQAAALEVINEENPPPVQRRKRRVAAEKARQVIKKLRIVDDSHEDRDDEYSPSKYSKIFHTPT